jgi:hypothetical protein
MWGTDWITPTLISMLDDSRSLYTHGRRLAGVGSKGLPLGQRIILNQHLFRYVPCPGNFADHGKGKGTMTT